MTSYIKNSQFIAVLDSIIYFSVWFYVSVRIHFHVFYFATKKLKGFSSDRKIVMSLLLVPFHLQNPVSAF